jgi:hypothetical protein
MKKMIPVLLIMGYFVGLFVWNSIQRASNEQALKDAEKVALQYGVSADQFENACWEYAAGPNGSDILVFPTTAYGIREKCKEIKENDREEKDNGDIN